MGVLQFPTPIPATVGSLPSLKFMVTTDGLGLLTTPGYLNPSNIDSGNPMVATDIVMALYSFNQQSKTGTFGLFTVSVAISGVITLSIFEFPGVLLPVVPGDLAQFVDANGKIGDSGIAAINVMQKNITNTLTPSGRIIANKVSGTEASNLVTANGMAGFITTSTLTIAPGSSNQYIITWTNSFITATSVVLFTQVGSTSTNYNCYYNIVPFNGTAQLTLTNNGSTNFNGVFVFSYLVF